MRNSVETEMENPFQTRTPAIEDNRDLRAPQKEAYAKLVDFSLEPDTNDREVGIILPVGCGKSGCITITPFAFRARRCLVVAPNVKIAEQLGSDFEMSKPGMFYKKCHILDGPPYPESAEIRGKTTNRADLETAHVVVTNIQQLQGAENRWLEHLPGNFFDLILFDEGHHNVAESWNTLKSKFPKAWIVNFSATPHRADGQAMAGKILYTYPVFRAIQEGYVKHLKALVLNPQKLRYVRRENDEEIEVDLKEVRRLGEENADFRRSIVTSQETLSTIVDASIRELYKLREASGEARLKIIASALNYEHCLQIVEAYRARSLRADYVHSRQDGTANQRVLEKLKSHDLDVIVQVRKLGEGFDHPWLAVAAVFSVFTHLSTFIQFVGRIMRVIKQNSPSDPSNQGRVVFHAGVNVARHWEDFQNYAEADQKYFDQLLPMEGLDFDAADELEVEPRDFADSTRFQVQSQSEVTLEEIPLIEDKEARAALETLIEKGFTPDDIQRVCAKLDPVPISKVRQRQAKRQHLDQRVQHTTGQILRERNLNPKGRELDRKRLGRSNFVVIKSAIDQQINALAGRGTKERHEFTREQLELAEQNFESIVEWAKREVF